jgi:hypothetical protein
VQAAGDGRFAESGAGTRWSGPSPAEWQAIGPSRHRRRARGSDSQAPPILRKHSGQVAAQTDARIFQPYAFDDWCGTAISAELQTQPQVASLSRGALQYRWRPGLRSWVEVVREGRYGAIGSGRTGCGRQYEGETPVVLETTSVCGRVPNCLAADKSLQNLHVPYSFGID